MISRCLTIDEESIIMHKNVNDKKIRVYNSYRSKIFWGVESPSILQWYTDCSVTNAIVFKVIHFQNMTSSCITWAFILDFISILNICNVFWAFKAITLLAGFIMAESAEMGLRMGLVWSAMSMMTTWLVSPNFSRTQMNLSDSMVRLLKPMLLALMPTLVSWKTYEKL